MKKSQRSSLSSFKSNVQLVLQSFLFAISFVPAQALINRETSHRVFLYNRSIIRPFSFRSSPFQVSSWRLRPFVPLGIRPFPCLFALVSLYSLSFATPLRCKTKN